MTSPPPKTRAMRCSLPFFKKSSITKSSDDLSFISADPYSTESPSQFFNRSLDRKKRSNRPRRRKSIQLLYIPSRVRKKYATEVCDEGSRSKTLDETQTTIILHDEQDDIPEKNDDAIYSTTSMEYSHDDVFKAVISEQPLPDNVYANIAEVSSTYF